MKEARLKSPLEEEEPALQDPQHADGPALFFLCSLLLLYPRLFCFLYV